MLSARASAENFSREGGNGKKGQKFSKKYRKIALFSLFQGGQRKKKTKKKQKRPKNSTFKPLLTIFVPCLKIHRGARLPAADAHGYPYYI